MMWFTFAGCRASSGRFPPPLWIRQLYSVVGGYFTDRDSGCQGVGDSFRFEEKQIQQISCGENPHLPICCYSKQPVIARRYRIIDFALQFVRIEIAKSCPHPEPVEGLRRGKFGTCHPADRRGRQGNSATTRRTFTSEDLRQVRGDGEGVQRLAERFFRRTEPFPLPHDVTAQGQGLSGNDRIAEFGIEPERKSIATAQGS